MSPWLKTSEVSTNPIVSSGESAPLVLRGITKWFLTLPIGVSESPDYSELWHELRTAERHLNNSGKSFDLSEIEAVIETAITLGYSSRTETK